MGIPLPVLTQISRLTYCTAIVLYRKTYYEVFYAFPRQKNFYPFQRIHSASVGLAFSMAE